MEYFLSFVYIFFSNHTTRKIIPYSGIKEKTLLLGRSFFFSLPSSYQPSNQQKWHTAGLLHNTISGIWRVVLLFPNVQWLFWNDCVLHEEDLKGSKWLLTTVNIVLLLGMGEEEGKSLMAEYFVSPWPSQRSTFFTAVICSQFTETLASKGYPFENMVITIQLDWFLVFSWWFHHHKTFARSSAAHEWSSKSFALLKYRQYRGKKRERREGTGEEKKFEVVFNRLGLLSKYKEIHQTT